MGNEETGSKKNIQPKQISQNVITKKDVPNNNNINTISINENKNQNPQITLKANPVKKKKIKKPYDLSQFEIREQIQETFIETIPIKVRKQDPSYFELKDGKISIGVPPGEEDDNQNRRRRPLRNRRNIPNIDISNKIGEDESEQVLVVIPMDDGTNWVREYDKGEPLQYIVDDFKEDKGEKLPENTKLDWKFNEDPLDFKAKIESLVPQLQHTVFLDLEIKQKGLDLNLDDEEEEEELTDVAKPFNNPFEVYSYNKYEKSFQILNFNKEDLENSEIEKFNLTSSYCNGNNHLYISGGENSLNQNRLWDVNLKNNSIKTYNLPNKKKNHSMIYVPNKYIFILGGNDKQVYYFDTESKEINNWGNLNEIHIEPSLGLYQNKEIYAFSNNNDKLVIEKTDLTSKKPYWEKIEPKLNDDIQKFDQKFSGVSLKGNKFIFLGGDMEKNGNEFNYEYDINKNLVNKSNIKFKKYNLKEKTFLKYNDSLDFLLTDFNKVKPEVLFFKKNKNIFKSFQFYPKLLNQMNSLNNKNKLKKSKKFNFDMPNYDSNVQTDNENIENVPINNEDKNSSYYLENNQRDEDINNQNNEVDLFLKQSNISLKNSKNKKALKSKKNNHKAINMIVDSSKKKKERNKDVDLSVYKFKPYKPVKVIDSRKYIKPLFIIDNSIDFSNKNIQINPNQTKLNDNLSNNIIIEEINTNANQNVEENIVKNSNLINDIKKKEEDPQYDGSLLKSSIILNNSIGSQKKGALPMVGDNKSSRKKITSSFIENSNNFNKNNIEQKNLGKSINSGIGGKKSE